MVKKACKLTIKTTVDGQTTTIARAGELTLGEEILLEYREEGAQVAVRLYSEKAVLQRKGDYGLYLPLEKGKTVGKLGFGGSEGEIPLQTDLVAYELVEGGLTVNLQYQLQFGKERQKMSLQITAREEK